MSKLYNDKFNFRSQDSEDLDELEYMRKLQAKFDSEENSYESLKKQYSKDKQAEGHDLGEDDWICEKCKKINKMPDYYCKK